MARPNFCPNCGAKLPDGSDGAQGFTAGVEDGEEIEGWECYCPACEWSGDILPDKVVPEKEVAHAELQNPGDAGSGSEARAH